MLMSLSEYQTNAEVEDQVGGLLLFGSLCFFLSLPELPDGPGIKNF